MPFADLTPQQQADVLAGQTVTVKIEPDKTQKLADSPAKRTDNAEPWQMFGWIDRLGGQEVRMLDPKNPSSYFLEKLHPNGSTETHESSSSEGAHTNELHAGHHRQYVAKGKHDHADGNHASSTSQNRHTDTSKDSGSAAGSNVYNGAGGKKVEGTGQGSFHNNTGGDTYQASSGDVIHSHDGHVHEDITGDSVRTVGGNSVEMLYTGDYGVYTSIGNFDITAEVGKGKIKSGQLLTVESPTSILMNCGLPGGAVGSKLFMTPASAQLSVGPIGSGTSIALTPVSVTITIGGSIIDIDGSGVTITAPSINFVRG